MIDRERSNSRPRFLRCVLLKILATTSLLLVSGLAHTKTAISNCPASYEPAVVKVQAVVSTNLRNCPLLEDNQLRDLADKHFFGAEFAYPMPGTCVSGSIDEGSLSIRGTTIQLKGTTESALRFFPEASATNPTMLGVFLAGTSQDGIPIMSGAAATVVSLADIHSDFELQLVMSDRFTINLGEYPYVDTEEFQVLGAEGASVTGRLTGRAEIETAPPAPFVDAPFTVEGSICIRLDAGKSSPPIGSSKRQLRVDQKHKYR